MKNLKRFEEWFNLKLGWFFINGRKQSEWLESLEEKYSKEKKVN